MPTATPYSAVNKDFRNEKDVGAVLFCLSHHRGSGKTQTIRISNQLAHVMRYYIRVQHLIIYNNI